MKYAIPALRFSKKSGRNLSTTGISSLRRRERNSPPGLHIKLFGGIGGNAEPDLGKVMASSARKASNSEYLWDAEHGPDEGHDPIFLTSS